MKLILSGLLVLLVCSTGFDHFAISISTAHVRLSFLAYLGIWLCYARKISYPVLPTCLILLFTLIGAVSIANSHDPLKSIMYLGWILFSYFIIFGLFAALARWRGAELFRAVVLAFRLQIAIAALLWTLGIQERGCLLYYEASYFSLALLIYAAIVMVGWQSGTGRLADLFFLLLALVVTQSALLLVGTAVIALSGMLLGGDAKRALRILLLALVVFAALCVYAQSSDDLLAQTFRNLLSRDQFANYLAERGGNRVPRMECAWDVFCSSPSLGVGVGAYESHISTLDVSAYSHQNHYLAVENQPAVSIVLELLATVGVLGTIPFLAFVIYSLVRAGRGDARQLSYKVALCGMLAVLAFDSNYLRPYFWMLLGICAGSTRAAHLAPRPVAFVPGTLAHE